MIISIMSFRTVKCKDHKKNFQCTTASSYKLSSFWNTEILKMKLSINYATKPITKVTEV